MEVKEQLAEGSSLLVGPMDHTQVVRSKDKHFQPLVTSSAPLFKTGQLDGVLQICITTSGSHELSSYSFLDPTETLRGKE